MKKTSKKLLGFLMAFALMTQSIGFLPVFADAGLVGWQTIEQGVVKKQELNEEKPTKNPEEPGGGIGTEKGVLGGETGTEAEVPGGDIVDGGDTPNGENGEITGEGDQDGIITELVELFSEPKDLGNIFTFGKLWIGRDYHENGTIKNEGTVIEPGVPIEVTDGTKVTMRYNWDVINKDANSGDTASIKIPDVFDSAGNFPKSSILLSDGTTVGSWTIEGGFLKFEFGKG